MSADTGGAPRDAGPGPEEEAEGLAALRLAWGRDYLFGYDPEHGWWAIEPGKLGSLLMAGSAGDLGEQLAGREAAGR